MARSPRESFARVPRSSQLADLLQGDAEGLEEQELKVGTVGLAVQHHLQECGSRCARRREGRHALLPHVVVVRFPDVDKSMIEALAALEPQLERLGDLLGRKRVFIRFESCVSPPSVSSLSLFVFC